MPSALEQATRKTVGAPRGGAGWPGPNGTYAEPFAVREVSRWALRPKAEVREWGEKRR
jgi:hypothetical protein